MVTAAVRVYEQLRTAILGGRFQEGSHLSEDRLAQSLGVSRTPVREALRRLSAEGLVEFLPNRGAQVVRWTTADLEDVFRVRALLEGHGAYLSATTMSEEDVSHLHKIADRMEELAANPSEESRDELARLDVEFHHAVVAGAASRRLLEAHARVVQIPLHHRVMRLYSVPQLHQRMVQHRGLAEAIQKGDGPLAEAVMRTHVLSALRLLLEED